MLYFFSNNCALVGENVSCYYLSRRIAIVLLPVAAQSDGQSSAIAGHHGLSLAAAAEPALASVSVQGRPLLSLVSAAPLLLQPFRQIDTIGRQAPSIEHNAQLFAAAAARAPLSVLRAATPQGVWFYCAPAVTPAISWRMDTANMYSCF